MVSAAHGHSQTQRRHRCFSNLLGENRILMEGIGWIEEEKGAWCGTAPVGPAHFRAVAELPAVRLYC
ncbi:hypothetical protein EVAR_62130_1 [Eumeta japonica]|uniref:Uncharacterized protein n=1 Tax=Eumeta variegata TaxID=151549 RepID=A0A4C1ZY83_EUMVA|nr:hypothetical protein EVAR_62130_1 [Eumeta japonica]